MGEIYIIISIMIMMGIIKIFNLNIFISGIIYFYSFCTFCVYCYCLYDKYRSTNHKFIFGADKIFDILVIITFQLFATQGINNTDHFLRFIIGMMVSSIASYCFLFKNI